MITKEIAREIANKVNKVEAHKNYISKMVLRSAEKGSYHCGYCYEGKLTPIAVGQILNWLESLGYSCQVFHRNSEVEFYISWK